MGPQGPPARAAPPLLKALRSARGSLLGTTWTSPHVGALPQPGVQFFASQGSSSGCRLTSLRFAARRSRCAPRTGPPNYRDNPIRSVQNAPAAE